MDSLAVSGILSGPMENRNLTPGIGRPGTARPAAPRPLPAGGKAPRAAAPRTHAPDDLSAATARLDRLLEQDRETGDGARAGVPQRDFYLNVLV